MRASPILLAALPLLGCGPAPAPPAPPTPPPPATAAIAPARPNPMEALESACDGGDMAACGRLGTHYAEARNTARAHPLLDKACTARDVHACTILGEIHHHGYDRTRDLLQAERFYRRACESGQNKVRACAYLASLLREPERNDPAQARQVLERACDADEPHSCALLALTFIDGVDPSRYPAEWRAGAKYCQRACDLGHFNACWRLGAMYRDGQGVTQSTTKARALFEKACDGGDNAGCEELRKKRGDEPR